AVVDHAHAADIGAGGCLADRPGAVAERLPVTDVAQEAEPDLLGGEGGGEDGGGEGPVAPERREVLEVGELNRREGEAGGDQGGGHMSPSCLKLATPWRPTTRWSCTAISSARAASTTCRVIWMSARDGVGSPEGWLCTMIRFLAESSRARRTT